jgi:hypothetical protein
VVRALGQEADGSGLSISSLGLSSPPAGLPIGARL